MSDRDIDYPGKHGDCAPRPRHYHDTPTIREMLDKMEEKRTVDASALVAALRLACDALQWYDEGHSPESRLSDNGEHAQQAIESITRSLWATSPRSRRYSSSTRKLATIFPLALLTASAASGVISFERTAAIVSQSTARSSCMFVGVVIWFFGVLFAVGYGRVLVR